MVWCGVARVLNAAERLLQVQVRGTGAGCDVGRYALAQRRATNLSRVVYTKPAHSLGENRDEPERVARKCERRIRADDAKPAHSLGENRDELERVARKRERRIRVVYTKPAHSLGENRDELERVARKRERRIRDDNGKSDDG